MSASAHSSRRSGSRKSRGSVSSAQVLVPDPSITPKNEGWQFDPCTATASHLLYAQRNVILCLRHHTLAIDRRFARHREDILWVEADNASEGHPGRLVVSYDTGQTALVWDLFSGEEVARFVSYEQIRVAAWMRNGNIAFGNSQGNVILFEPSTSEHVSTRTIFDPITALAPLTDCRTFAIGYLNGSILIATLQPTFTILHTLTTARAPSPIAQLAWHASSSRQKNDLLAAQTSDGDLRVWSVPKSGNTDTPNTIRILNRTENTEQGPCWFAWSKNGRIVQHSEDETRLWDVRTKRISYDIVPTMDGIVAVANYGPSATLYTLCRNHTVQQYDINPNETPALVANVKHVPSDVPPSPPHSIEGAPGVTSNNNPAATLISNMHTMPAEFESASADDKGHALSPLEKIAKDMDQMTDESRDHLAPLSPVSSRSSASSKSSAGRRYRYETDQSVSRQSSSGTIFSHGNTSQYGGQDNMSIRSYSSAGRSRFASSSLRREVLRSPEEAQKAAVTDLFPHVKARLKTVPFKVAQLPPGRTVDELRQQMLSVIFGWERGIEFLIRDQISKHAPGSASGVLLSKWLGESGADIMASMVGTESMTSSDWMLLALSSVGHDSQRKVGEAFVQRLLDKGDVHPAVAILLGLGERMEAIEAYAARKYYMEAVLLTCLALPGDWQRQSYYVRKWGEVAVAQGMPELAVRCFSCTSLEAASAAPDPWSLTTSQDLTYAAANQQLPMSRVVSPPLSPPSAGSGTGSIPGRVSVKNSSLKLITSFGNKNANEPQLLSTGDTMTPRIGAGVTPIAESAISPGGMTPWVRSSARSARESSRDPSSARTATPGAARRKKISSRNGSSRDISMDATPLATIARARGYPETSGYSEDGGLRTSSSRATSESDMGSRLQERTSVASSARYGGHDRRAERESLPSPSEGAFNVLMQDPRARHGSRDRKPTGLHVSVHDTVEVHDRKSTSRSFGALSKSGSDMYISDLSFEEASQQSSKQRAISQTRSDGRSRKKIRDSSKSKLNAGPRAIRPARRSPSSPAPMSPEETARYREAESYDDERYYQVTSPTDSRQGRTRSISQNDEIDRQKSYSRASRRKESPEGVMSGRSGSRVGDRVISRNASRQVSPEGLKHSDRGRSEQRNESSLVRSPSSPLPMSLEARFYKEDEEDTTAGSINTTGDRTRSRQHSSSGRARSKARSTRGEEGSPERAKAGRVSSRSRGPSEYVAQRLLTRKEIAARELEERRLSLARRPSAPPIPHPGELSAGRPPGSGRSFTEVSHSPTSNMAPPMAGIGRSQSVDPETMMNCGDRSSRPSPGHSADSFTRPNSKAISGTSTSSVPIGLPATPRAMRHPRYMSADPSDGNDDIPAVPEIPDRMSSISPLSQARRDFDTDAVAPLLPSTVYSQKSPTVPGRSASVPLEHGHNSDTRDQTVHHASDLRRKSSSRSGQMRKGSSNEPSSKYAPHITASIDETLHDNQAVIVGDDGTTSASASVPAPPLLAELQHLAGPPPPPPPPVSAASASTAGAPEPSNHGVINIVMDERGAATPAVEGTNKPALSVLTNTTAPMSATSARAAAGSPPLSAGTQHSSHRRARSNASEHSLGNRIRSAAERIRSSSKSRAVSPPIERTGPAPYESILPTLAYGQEHAGASSSISMGSPPPANVDAIPPPPPPPPSMGSPQPMEQVISPIQQQRSQKGGGGNGYAVYKHPKEVRANMPPDQLQLGVVQPVESGMI